MEPDHLSKRFRKKRSVSVRSKRDAPYVIYPEILCIVDYDGYRLVNLLISSYKFTLFKKKKINPFFSIYFFFLLYSGKRTEKFNKKTRIFLFLNTK